MDKESLHVDKQTSAEVHIKLDRLSDSRRKLIRGGLTGVPLLILLKGTPVLAANCKSPSGFSVSGLRSRPDDFACNRAKGVAYWINECNLILAQFSKDSPTKKSEEGGVTPLLNNPKDSLPWPYERVNIKLGESGYGRGSYNKRTLAEALKSGDRFVSLIVAAYLNCTYNAYAMPVSVYLVRSMWVDGPRFGFRPAGGSKTTWFVPDITEYLNSIMEN